MTKSYEELVGALGRGIFFRPERKRVRDLLSRDAEPRLIVGAETFKLFDVSMNGLSFVCPSSSTPFEVDAEVELTLQLYGEAAYAGRARVARVEPSRSSTRVAVSLTSGFLDLPEMIRRDEEARFSRELGSGGEDIQRLVPPAYERVVADIVYVLQHYQRALARQERRVRGEATSTGGAALAALVSTTTDAIRPRWQAIERRASEAALSFLNDPVALRAAKEYTETTLTQLVLDAPMYNRSYLKPLGYAGDYQTMLYVYADSFEGDTLFGRVMHKLVVEHPLAAGIRARRDLIVDLMEAEHKRALGQQDLSFQVTSLGCGPAREVADYIRRSGSWPGKASWTLIDQEEETLSVAYRDSQRALAQHGAQGQLSCLNLSFGQLLSDPSFLQATPDQHFIYSTGLFDYLPEQRAQAVIGALFERLKPGGLLAIGNAVGPNLHFWTLEFLLDWTLLYRTREQMQQLAAKLPATAEVEVVTEAVGAYYFLLIRKH